MKLIELHIMVIYYIVLHNKLKYYYCVGPLLFLIYINDIVNVSNNLFPILFADDTNFFSMAFMHTVVKNIVPSAKICCIS